MSDTTSSMIEYADDLANQTEPPLLPANTYPAEIVGAQVRVSGAGNKYLQISFRIDPTQYPADYVDGDTEGTVVMYNRLVVSNKAQDRWRMKNAMEAMGGPTGKSIDVNELLGLSAHIAVRASEFEGEKRLEVAKIVKP